MFSLAEKCLRLALTNGVSDSTYNVVAANTQFAGCSEKYFGTYPAD